MKFAAARTVSLLASLLLAGCAQLPLLQPAAAGCTEAFAQTAAAVEQAGARDNGSYRIPGFAYLRSNRFLASLSDQLSSPAQEKAWVAALREEDRQAHAIELANAGYSAPRQQQIQAGLDRCADQLSAQLLATPELMQKLRMRAAVPDDYSSLARFFGAYVFAVPFLKHGISGYHDEVRTQFAQPLTSILKSPVVAWTAKKTAWPSVNAAASIIREAPHDALGIPQLSPDGWNVLASVHAPQWAIETAGMADRIGRPLPVNPPQLDLQDAVTYVQPGYTRFGNQVLVQLSYVIWFPQRPANKALDAYAGTLDGLIWRVTFDALGQPLLYDTIHACGCYHYYFTAQPLQRREKTSYWEEVPLLPQPGEIAQAPPAVVVQSGTHYVLRVAGSADLPAATNTQTYRLAPYSALLALDDGSGGTRSLFDEAGMVRGSERLERWWLWPSGVRNAGAMRQWGRHATAFVGTAHFDDPDLLDRLFKQPAAIPAGGSPQ